MMWILIFLYIVQHKSYLKQWKTKADQSSSLVSKLCTKIARTDNAQQLSDSMETTSLPRIPLQAVKKQDIVYLGRLSVTNTLPVLSCSSHFK